MDEMVKKAVRKLLVTDRKRADGRAMDELRPITCEVDILPMTHGSALFTRGETQSLGVTTLGMIGLDDQMMDGLKLDEPSKRFILHYNFPPYSVGEVRPMRGPGRREIGHGALAERALRALCSLTTSHSPTSCARSPIFWSPTAPARWPPYAAAAFR